MCSGDLVLNAHMDSPNGAQGPAKLPFLWAAHSILAENWGEWKQNDGPKLIHLPLDGVYMDLLESAQVGLARGHQFKKLEFSAATYKWTVFKLHKRWEDCLCNCANGPDSCTGERQEDGQDACYLQHAHAYCLPLQIPANSPRTQKDAQAVYFVVPSARLPRHLCQTRWKQPAAQPEVARSNNMVEWQATNDGKPDRLVDIITEALKDLDYLELYRLFFASNVGMARVSLQELLSIEEMMEFLQLAQAEVTRETQKQGWSPMQIMFKYFE